MVYNLIMGDFNYLVSVRRKLHRLAEPSDAEYKTSDFIANELSDMGHKFRRIHTGIVCDLKGADTKRTVALRCDIDALPIIEKSDCPFKAEGEYMHACGHDGHTAILLAVAKELSVRRPSVNVRLIFQFGEEGNGGAEKMIDGGAIDGVDEIYAVHMCPELEIGKVSSTDGAMFAGTIEFDVEFTGKSCHCADSSQGNDALKAAVYYCSKAFGCNSDCSSNTVYHTGKLVCGTARNIVAAQSVAECTLRYFDSATADKLMMRLESYLVESDNLFGTEHRLTVKAVYPPLINNPAALGKVKKIAEVRECEARFTAEDFAFYLQKIPGCMLWLGCKDSNYTSPLHSDTFGFDEKALETGVNVFEKLIFS